MELPVIVEALELNEMVPDPFLPPLAPVPPSQIFVILDLGIPFLLRPSPLAGQTLKGFVVLAIKQELLK